MPETLDVPEPYNYGLLGPVIVTCEDRKVPLPPGGKAEKIIAILLISGGEYVTAEKLSELLGITEGAVHTTVYRLQKLYKSLGLKSPIKERDKQGYRLKFDPGRVDVNEFRGLAEKAEEAIAQGDLEIALKYLDEALSLWRGDHLPVGLELYHKATDLADDLETERAEARLQWCGKNLDLGRPRKALPTAQRMVNANSLSQPAVEVLARAQADIPTLGPRKALQTIKDYRDLCETEGIPPTPSLTRLQQEIQRRLNE